MEQVLDGLETLDVRDQDNPLSETELAAFLDGRLEGDDLARVQAHLADNPSARQEMIEASRMVTTLPDQRRAPASRWLYVGASLAAAAALLVAVRPDKPSSVERTSIERRADPAESERITLVFPASGQTVEPERIRFAWRRYNGSTYRLVVSDATGHIMFKAITTDTVLSVTPETLKGAHDKIYWTVDAQAPDGSSVRSEISDFELKPRQ